MTTPAPPNAAPPDVLAGQILQRYGQVLAQYQQRVAGRDCPVARRWQAATGSSLADFPGWLARQPPQLALVKVFKVVNAPFPEAGRSVGVEPGAEVLLQMGLLALVQLLAQHYAAPLKSAAGLLLHLPMLQDTVLALLVACRCGVAVHLSERGNSDGSLQLEVTNLISGRQETQAGYRGVLDNIDIERQHQLRRLALARKVSQLVLPENSSARGQVLLDYQLQAWVDDAADDAEGLTPIVVLAWDEADLARDIEQRWGVRTVLRGDTASAPSDSPQRAAALQFSDAGQHVDRYIADLARLLRTGQLAPAAAPATKPLVCISYARENLALQQRLHDFLQQHRSTLDIWTDQDLLPGQNWHEIVRAKFAGCQVAVLLQSIEFNRSDYIAQHEMPEIQRRHAAGQLQVVTVVAGNCKLDYFDWLPALQSAHPPEQPLLAMDPIPRDTALNAIAAKIAQLATQAAKDRPA